MENNKQNNDAMPSKGVRLRVDQWEDCDKFYETLGLASRNDFIRDAVDFYIEYLRRNNSVKFLTPALESVVRGIVKDSEDRNARLLFKMVASIYKPFSVNTLGIVRLLVETFVDEIFDRKSPNSSEVNVNI